jgi:hypothetical protein
MSALDGKLGHHQVRIAARCAQPEVLAGADARSNVGAAVSDAGDVAAVGGVVDVIGGADEHAHRVVPS